jgi:hypothetical protein
VPMNRTEAKDRAEAKTREARHVAKWMRSGTQWTGQHPVQGFATVPARCLDCGTQNDVPKQQGHYLLGPCTTCGVEREQERVW